MPNTTCPVSPSELSNDNGLTVDQEMEFKAEVERMKPIALLHLIDDKETLQEAVDANIDIIHEMMNESFSGIDPENMQEMKNFEIQHFAQLAIRLINGIEHNLSDFCEKKSYELARN